MQLCQPTTLLWEFAQAQAPTGPSDTTAQELAKQELAKAKYHGEESLFEKLINWLSDHLNFTIEDISSQSSAGLIIALLAIAVAIVIVILVVRAVKLRQVGKNDGGTGVRLALFGDSRNSTELFAAGAKARAAGDIATAIIENFRGLVRLLDERKLILVRPGLTATEAAIAGSKSLGERERFLQAAEAFNGIYFAGYSGTEAQLAQLDRLIQIAQRTPSAKDNSLVTLGSFNARIGASV